MVLFVCIDVHNVVHDRILPLLWHTRDVNRLRYTDGMYNLIFIGAETCT